MNSSALKESTEPVDAQVNGNSLGAGGIRLNLGGRGIKIKGFQTVDLSEEHDVQIKSDVSNLWMFRDGSVDEIYASQILEHFPHVKTESVLKEWYRVLKPGSRITIGVPDFHRAIEIYLNIGLVSWVTNQLYGDQIYPLAFHYAPFTFASLAAQLTKVGFRNVKRLTQMPYGIMDCSANVFNLDGKSVSLNVEAHK
jgi:predicted SAM-dependent methyltransferase